MGQPEHLRKHIVIVGGGFAGLAAALELEKLRTAGDLYNVSLVDRNCYHLYHALLYEVATAALNITEKDIAYLQSGVCVRLKALGHILLKKNVQVIQAEVTGVDLAGRRLELADRSTLSFDYLILALGSVTQYFNIPGLEAHSLTLKDLPDALQIHIQLDKLFARVMKDKKLARVLIGGGGVAGVEIAGELKHYAQKLCARAGINPSLVAVKILEASPTLMSGLGSWAQQAASRRLADLGVDVQCGVPIIAVSDSAVTLKDGSNHPYDSLIWAGGIQAHHLLRTMGITCVGNKSQASVKPTLQLPNHDHAYAVGDGMYLIDPTNQRPLPQVATLAVAEGRHAADNVYRQIHGQPLQAYVPKHSGFVIPIGGRWAISTIGPRLAGTLGWLMRKWVDLEYFLSILRWPDALNVFWRGGRVYLKND